MTVINHINRETYSQKIGVKNDAKTHNNRDLQIWQENNFYSKNATSGRPTKTIRTSGHYRTWIINRMHQRLAKNPVLHKNSTQIISRNPRAKQYTNQH